MGFYQMGLGIGLAYVAGIRSYFPLLLVGLIGRYGDRFPLQAPFRFLTAAPVLVALIVLMSYEVLAERAVGYATGHAIMQLVIKVLAGGMIFAGLFKGMGNLFGLIFGGLIAALAHFLLVYGLPGDRSGVSVSSIKDALAISGAVLILLFPWISYVFWALILYLLIRRLRLSSRYSSPRRTRSWR